MKKQELLHNECAQSLTILFDWNRENFAETGKWGRYFIQTFGCQQNDHDSEIAAGLENPMNPIITGVIYIVEPAVFCCSSGIA